MKKLLLAITGIIIFLFTIMGALATTNTLNVVYTGGGNDFNHAYNFSLYNATSADVSQAIRVAGDTVYAAYLHAANGTIVRTAIFDASNFANFSTSFQIVSGQNYMLSYGNISDNASNNVHSFRSNINTLLPVANSSTPYINWTANSVINTTSGKWISSTIGFSIVSITTANESNIPTAPSTPTWVFPTPADGVTNNTQVTLNASSTSPGVRYFIWFDNNTNPTTLVVNNATTGNWTTNVTLQRTYYYKAQVWNSSAGYSANTSVQNWTYDITNPVLTLNPTNQFNAQNYSLRAQYANTTNTRDVRLNLTFSDNHLLYGYNINITRGSTVFYNETNITITGLQFNYTRTVNVSTWPAGWYNISIEVDDTHTQESIRDYVVTSNSTGLRFQTDEGNDIRVMSLNGSVNAGARKALDRYSFRFNFTDRQIAARSFLIRADNPIEYVPSSGFKAHFVVLGSGLRGNWIDFEGVPGIPIVRQLNARNWIVTFLSLDPDIEFQSVGGLNVLTANYSFYLGNYTESAPSPVLANDASTFSLNMSRDASQSSINATFVYNGTLYNPSFSNDTGYVYFNISLLNFNGTATVNYYWNITVIQGDNNQTNFTFTRTQSVQDWQLVLCGSNATMNFTSYDENTPSSRLFETVEAEITYWSTNTSVTKFLNASGSTTNTTSFSICLTPSTATLYADVYIKHTVTGVFTHRFFVNNGTYTNTTTQYSLYNANATTGFSALEITTRYVANYSPFPNVYAHLQRHYVGEGVTRDVQMYKSGDYGLIFFDIKEVVTDYRILFYDHENNLLRQTDYVTFACDPTTAVCTLTQLLDPSGNEEEDTNPAASVSFNNLTKVITVTWSSTASAGSTAVIKVIKESLGNSTPICSATQTGNAGTSTCNVSVYTGQMFVTVYIDSESALGEWVDVPMPRLADFVSAGDQALYTFIIMVVIVAAGLFSPVAAVLGLVLGLIIIFFLGIFNPLTATAIIIAGVVSIVIAIKLRA